MESLIIFISTIFSWFILCRQLFNLLISFTIFYDGEEVALKVVIGISLSIPFEGFCHQQRPLRKRGDLPPPRERNLQFASPAPPPPSQRVFQSPLFLTQSTRVCPRVSGSSTRVRGRWLTSPLMKVKPADQSMNSLITILWHFNMNVLEPLALKNYI